MKPKRKGIRVIVVVVCILLLAFVLTELGVIAVPVSRQVTALEVSLEDPTHVVEREVSIQGRWRFYPITQIRRGYAHGFYGQIAVSGYPITNYPMLSMWIPRDENGALVGHLRYDQWDHGVFGTMWVRTFFREAAIAVAVEIEVDHPDSRGWNTSLQESPVIVLDVETQAEALEILRSYIP